MNLQDNATASSQQSPANPEPMEVAQLAIDIDNGQESLSDDDNNSLDEEAVLVWRADNVGAGAFGGNIAAAGDLGDCQHQQNQLGPESGQSGAGSAALTGDAVQLALIAAFPPVLGAAAAAAAPMEAMGDFIDIDVNGADFDAEEADGASASNPNGNRNQLRNNNAHSNGILGDNHEERADSSDENDNAGGATGAAGAMVYDRYSSDHLPMAMALSAAAAAAAASAASAASAAAAAAAAAAAVSVTASSPSAAMQPNTWPDELLNDLSSDASSMPPLHLPSSQPQLAILSINNLSADSSSPAAISNAAHATTSICAHTTSKLSQASKKQQTVELHRRRNPEDQEDDNKSDQCWLWTQSEAQYVELQLLGGGGRLGPSSCGPAALLFTLKALGINADPGELSATVPASIRVQNAGLTAYLLSRARAGTTAHELIDGVLKFTNGRVRGRFFACYPRRRTPGKHGWYRWLASWMSRGAVPIVTLNPQVLGCLAATLVNNKTVSAGAVSAVLAGSSSNHCGRVVADAWHHQMVHGVTREGAYLTNPLGLVPWPSLCSQLCSDSVLLVRKADVCKLWNPSEDLAPLATQPDPRWASMNVLGQVVCLLRESQHHEFDGFRPKCAHHIRLPAAYQSGVSLFATEPGLCKLLAEADDLPLAGDSDDDDEEVDDGADVC